MTITKTKNIRPRLGPRSEIGLVMRPRSQTSRLSASSDGNKTRLLRTTPRPRPKKYKTTTAGTSVWDRSCHKTAVSDFKTVNVQSWKQDRNVKNNTATKTKTENIIPGLRSKPVWDRSCHKTAVSDFKTRKQDRSVKTKTNIETKAATEGGVRHRSCHKTAVSERKTVNVQVHRCGWYFSWKHYALIKRPDTTVIAGRLLPTWREFNSC